ncbi:hypothetical protein M2113_000608 [Aurantimicrobium minutum]|uniref:hypothetical protein n=1 Tax=Aurantimicrobium minutum TaxID=708131 RepID=UPI002476CA8A|nr:hypothetical protein [Aurantimicrobium minutum]MDH6409647.1 hypothetical protein [Aurantimicrobium minutum]
MSGRMAENKEYYIAGTVWNIWADYWVANGGIIPPLHYLRVGGGEDFIFVSAVANKDLDGFIQAVQAAPDLKFQKQGDWWLQTIRWFGHWTVFSASVRQGYIGLERRVWGYDEVIDFDGSGDPRMTPLRPS